MTVYRFIKKDTGEILYAIKLKERLWLDYEPNSKLFFIEEATPARAFL